MFLAFIKTIWAARKVFVFYFTVIFIASGMGHMLMRTKVNAGLVSNSFTTFFRSLITTFVFISTGDNYEACVYKAYESSIAYGNSLYSASLLSKLLFQWHISYFSAFWEHYLQWHWFCPISRMVSPKLYDLHC
jgi:hypothetical protein